MRMNYRAGIAALILLVASMAAPAQQLVTTDFTVGDIKIEGLQRISEGTVFNYLPVNIGDQLTPERVREALQIGRAHV
jgi:outer membrane protein insertion porin family